MPRPPKPSDEAARLAALRKLEILDTPAEEDFDHIVGLASRICGVPVSLVSLIDADRQWFKARLGIDQAESSRDLSFCAYAILGRDLMVVPDATRDERFADNPAVRVDSGVRFYAGAPLVTTDGHALGTLCVVDAEPHRLTVDQLRALRALARQVTAQLELRHVAESLGRATERLHALERRMDEFTTLVGGELREPLARLRAYFARLESGPEPEPEVADSIAKVARTHAGALGRLVDDLLFVAGAGGDTGLRMRRVDLSRLTERAVDAVRPISNAKRIWILHETGPELPVLADPVRLEQALMHLLFSAVKYTPEGGRVQVATEAEAGPAILVHDLDSPEGARPSLFERLYHGAIAQPPGPRGREGGLAVTKQILDVHHATLAMSDRPGEGTALHVVFPSPGSVLTAA